MTEEQTGMSRGKKIVVSFIIVFLVLSAMAYFIGVYYFSQHFLPGSLVNGFNCSYMTVKEAEDLLEQRIGAYVLAIRTRGNGQEALSAQQAELTYVSDGSVKQLIHDQNRFLWFLAFGQKQSYAVPSSVSMNYDLLFENIDQLYCMQPENVTAPKDACITLEGETFVIQPEVEGNQLKRESVQEVIIQAMASGKTAVDLEAENCYFTPAVYATDEQLIRNCEQINELTDIVVTYDFADRTETVDRDEIKNWLVLDDNGDYTLSRDKVAEYVYELAYEYDTFGGTHYFRTYNGREITVSGGDYGWVIDQEAETEALIEVIESGVTQVREPVYLYEGWSRDSNDIGYTYIEIDLTNQRMVMYKDGVPIVDTYVVTGNPNLEGMATPTGVYAVDAMMSPATLTGEDYEADVTYWIPFCGNVGIHDATWRTEFGNNLYLLEGSHGCVNAPYDKAQAIYHNTSIGMPVVVYE